MKVIQNYSRAINSSNLKDDEHHHATEVLAAAALASALGTKLFRVKYASDATSYNALLTSWHEIVKAKAGIRGWPSDVSASQIARLSLDYWLNDVCTVCCGTGHESVPNVPNVLRDEPCGGCNGTAKRPIQARNGIVKYMTEAVEALEAMTIHAGGATMRKLAKKMDL